ncbi:MAG: leucine-rich repeat domain-containing protein [Paludibacteraceae bacterium]|nr:leucine-rich repeat domain-containing protein [Paludibacteraceae bacterium]
MKTNPRIKSLAVIVSIILMIPTSINWFSFLKCNFYDDSNAPVTPLEFTVLTDSTAAVSKCRPEIENISIPEKIHIEGKDYTVTKIGKKAFSYCRKLTNIIIPSSVTEIEYSAFSGCSSLTNVKLPSNITCINDFTFNECTNLKIIIIPSNVTNIGYEAFEGCNNLDVIINNSKYGVNVEMYAFKGCKSVRYTK